MRKNIIIFGSLVVVGIVLYQVFINISRVGETKVLIKVLPENAKISIDSKPVSGKVVYVTPDISYVFGASAEGYKDASETKIVRNQVDQTVVFVLEPTSDEILNNLADNKRLQLERESLGAEQRLNTSNSEVPNPNNLVNNLPYSDVSAPFNIDYGFNDSSVLLVIDQSDYIGRTKAIDWIRSMGYDPGDYIIEFKDARGIN